MRRGVDVGHVGLGLARETSQAGGRLLETFGDGSKRLGVNVSRATHGATGARRICATAFMCKSLVDRGGPSPPARPFCFRPAGLRIRRSAGIQRGSRLRGLDARPCRERACRGARGGWCGDRPGPGRRAFARSHNRVVAWSWWEPPETLRLELRSCVKVETTDRRVSPPRWQRREQGPPSVAFPTMP